MTRVAPHGSFGIELRMILLLAFAMLIVSLDQYIVVVALPEIGRDLGYSAHTLQSVVSAYTVASSGFLLLGGRAADLFGRRRMFVAGLALYAGASLAGGLSTSPAELLVARALQGLGGALVFPATLALLNTTFTEGSERNRALAVWGGAGAAGLVVGVLLGGFLTHAFGWAWVFFVNVPLAVAAIVFAFVIVDADGRLTGERSFDLPGALVSTSGVTLLVLALMEGPTFGWTSPIIITSAIVAALLLAVFTIVERNSEDPLVPRRLLANGYVSTATAVAFLFMSTFGSVLYFLSIYLQDVHGYDAMETGFAFLLPTCIVVASSSAAGGITTRFGLRPTMIAALCVGAAGAATLAMSMSSEASYAALIPGLIALSLGDGAVFTTMFIAASTGVPDREQGIASAIASTGSGLGAAIGLACLVLVANWRIDGFSGDALRVATADGLRITVLCVAVGISFMIPLAWNLHPSRDR